MVSMEVTRTLILSIAKLGEHFIDGRVAKSKLAEQTDDLRFPSTVHAPPLVALEAQNP